MKRHCPECKQILSKAARDCYCGWQQSQPIEADHRCKYSISQRRCPLPGSMSTNTHAGGPWYCSGHWQTLGDPKLAEAVLIDAEKNYYKILEERRDWRQKLFEN